MIRTLAVSALLFVSATLVCAANHSQDPATAAPPAPAPSPDSPQPPAKADKPKKVWTNDDLTESSKDLNSRAGNAKKSPKAANGSDKPVDSQVVAGLKKQLDKLQSQLADTDKELTNAKNFRDGEPTGAAGMQLHKNYGMESIDEQIRTLEEKKKQLQDKMDALLDDARKKGVEPGQLR